MFYFRDYIEFLEDLEEDVALRQHVAIYKKDNQQTAIPIEGEDVDPSMPQITLEEMLDDLTLDDVEMEEEIQDEDDE